MEELLGDKSFWVAAGAALLLLLATRVLARVAHVITGDGVAVAGGTLVGLAEVDRLPVELPVALVLLALGAWFAPSGRIFAWGLAAIPGAALGGAAVTANAPTWTAVAAAAAIVGFVPLAQQTDVMVPRLTAVLVGISAIGVYVTVPNTEEARVLLAATLVGAVLGPTRRAADPAGIAVLVGLLAWTSAEGGYARPGSVVGGLACIGVLALASTLRTRMPLVLTVVHVALVVVASRIAGLRERAWVAIVIVIGTYACAVVFTRVALRRRGTAR